MNQTVAQPAALIGDYIQISTRAWIEQRTGGQLAPLDTLFHEFDSSVQQQSSYAASSLDTVALFITARAGSDWESAEFARFRTAAGGDTVNLSDDVVITRYTDPVFGDVAFVALDHGAAGLDMAIPYADTVTESSDWLSVEAEIFCPNEHGWTLRTGGELVTKGGSFAKAADVFGPGGVVTLDLDISAATYGDPRIVCPTCSAPCAVALPGL